MSRTVETAIEHWRYIQPLVEAPKNEEEYKRLAEHLDEILDICADNEKHPLWGLANTISEVISRYDEQHYSIPKASGIAALKYLMQEHSLTQEDLKNMDIGSQGVVSELLNKKRNLNLRQIKILAQKFNVSADTFLD
jgi:HTH-type transcriptional regulator/antitoxin HigA